MKPLSHGKRFTTEQEQQIISTLEDNDIALPGDRAYVKKVLGWIKWGDRVRSVVEAFVSFGYQASKFLNYYAFFNILITPIRHVLAIVHAKESGQKCFVVKAMAYTTAAWAFEDMPCPPIFPVNHRKGSRESGGHALELESQLLWDDSCRKMLTFLNQPKVINGKKVSPEKYRIALRIIGKGCPAELAIKVWDSMESEFPRGIQRDALYRQMKDTGGVVYPY